MAQEAKPLGTLALAKIPLWDKKNDKKVKVALPFLLPHDWLHLYLGQPGAFQEGLPEEGTWLAREWREAMKALGEPEEGNSMYPLGLHGDGVPVKGRKNQSTLDYWTINFVGSRKNGRARFLIGCGQRACRRHDGKKLDMAKAWRRQLSSS